MSNSDGLFWYPAINAGLFPDKINKAELLDSYIRYFLSRLQSMFQYDGLPETIPAKWLESYLMCNGNALIAQGPDGQLYAFTGGYGGDPNAYYIPTKYIVANPYLQFTKTYDIYDGLNKDGNAALIYNDTYAQGLIPMLRRYCTQLVENDVTMNIADILARATINISTADDKTKSSAELYLKRLRDGELGVLAETAFIEGLNIREFASVSGTLTNLIEYHQYIKASLFNELGLNSNYNMKRESINSNESQLNDDMLHPLIDDMLKEREEGIARVNELFGTNITVKFAGAWESNEIEEQAALDSMLAGEVVEDETAADVSDVNDNDTASDNSIADNEEVSEGIYTADDLEPLPEDVSEDDQEAQIIEDNNAAIAEAIEQLTEAVEDVTEALEDEKGAEDENSN